MSRSRYHIGWRLTILSGIAATLLVATVKAQSTTSTTSKTTVTTTTVTTTTVTTTTVKTCSAGEFLRINQNNKRETCQPCADDEFQSQSEHREQFCCPHATCGSGLRTRQKSASSNVVCLACGDNEYYDEQSDDCKAVRTCGVGQRLDFSDGLDGRCVDCADREYMPQSDHRNELCFPQAPCSMNTRYLGNKTHQRECVPCSVGFFLNSEAHYQMSCRTLSCNSGTQFTGQAALENVEFVGCTGLVPGATCLARCAEGYTATVNAFGVSLSTNTLPYICGVNGQLTVTPNLGNQLTCVPVKCPKPTYSNSGKDRHAVGCDDQDSFKFGDTCEVSCPRGFYGVKTDLECLADGTWSGSIICVPRIKSKVVSEGEGSFYTSPEFLFDEDNEDDGQCFVQNATRYFTPLGHAPPTGTEICPSGDGEIRDDFDLSLCSAGNISAIHDNGFLCANALKDLSSWLLAYGEPKDFRESSIVAALEFEEVSPLTIESGESNERVKLLAQVSLDVGLESFHAVGGSGQYRWYGIGNELIGSTSEWVVSEDGSNFYLSGQIDTKTTSDVQLTVIVIDSLYGTSAMVQVSVLVIQSDVTGDIIVEPPIVKTGPTKGIGGLDIYEFDISQGATFKGTFEALGFSGDPKCSVHKYNSLGPATLASQKSLLSVQQYECTKIEPPPAGLPTCDLKPLTDADYTLPLRAVFSSESSGGGGGGDDDDDGTSEIYSTIIESLSLEAASATAYVLEVFAGPNETSSETVKLVSVEDAHDLSLTFEPHKIRGSQIPFLSISISEFSTTTTATVAADLDFGDRCATSDQCRGELLCRIDPATEYTFKSCCYVAQQQVVEECTYSILPLGSICSSDANCGDSFAYCAANKICTVRPTATSNVSTSSATVTTATTETSTTSHTLRQDDVGMSIVTIRYTKLTCKHNNGTGCTNSTHACEIEIPCPCSVCACNAPSSSGGELVIQGLHTDSDESDASYDGSYGEDDTPSETDDDGSEDSFVTYDTGEVLIPLCADKFDEKAAFQMCRDFGYLRHESFSFENASRNESLIPETRIFLDEIPCIQNYTYKCHRDIENGILPAIGSRNASQCQTGEIVSLKCTYEQKPCACTGNISTVENYSFVGSKTCDQAIQELQAEEKFPANLTCEDTIETCFIHPNTGLGTVVVYQEESFDKSDVYKKALPKGLSLDEDSCILSGKIDEPYDGFVNGSTWKLQNDSFIELQSDDADGTDLPSSIPLRFDILVSSSLEGEEENGQFVPMSIIFNVYPPVMVSITPETGVLNIPADNLTSIDRLTGALELNTNDLFSARVEIFGGIKPYDVLPANLPSGIRIEQIFVVRGVPTRETLVVEADNLRRAAHQSEDNSSVFVTTVVPQNFTFRVLDSKQSEAEVPNIPLQIGHDDCLDASNGPGSQDCGEFGTCSDSNFHDRSFSCECEFEYYGENCENKETTVTQPPVATQIPQQSSDDSNSTMIIIIFVVVIVVFGSIALVYIWYQRKLRLKPHDFNAELQKMLADGKIKISVDPQNGEQGLKVPKELKRSRIVVLDRLGSGAFGDVNKGLYNPDENIPEFPVAIKVLKEGANREEKEELMKEATITAQFDHPNVVMCIGVITSGEPEMLIIQLCEKGALNTLLKESAAKDAHISQDKKCVFCFDITKGMAYLSGLGFVHRDLAARNVLVDANSRCKIADFGLARDREDDEYYVATKGKIPIRWTAPEALTDRKFSEASDVWAFGITCIEVFQNGETPYKGWMNAIVQEQVKAGIIHPKPDECEEQFFDAVIKPCFAFDRSQRPAFASLEILMQAFVEGTAEERQEAIGRLSMLPTANDAYSKIGEDDDEAQNPSENDYVYSAENASGDGKAKRSSIDQFNQYEYAPRKQSFFQRLLGQSSVRGGRPPPRNLDTVSEADEAPPPRPPKLGEVHESSAEKNPNNTLCCTDFKENPFRPMLCSTCQQPKGDHKDQQQQPSGDQSEQPEQQKELEKKTETAPPPAPPRSEASLKRAAAAEKAEKTQSAMIAEEDYEVPSPEKSSLPSYTGGKEDGSDEEYELPEKYEPAAVNKEDEQDLGDYEEFDKVMENDYAESTVKMSMAFPSPEGSQQYDAGESNDDIFPETVDNDADDVDDSDDDDEYEQIKAKPTDDGKTLEILAKMARKHDEKKKKRFFNKGSSGNKKDSGKKEKKEKKREKSPKKSKGKNKKKKDKSGDDGDEREGEVEEQADEVVVFDSGTSAKDSIDPHQEEHKTGGGDLEENVARPLGSASVGVDSDENQRKLSQAANLHPAETDFDDMVDALQTQIQSKDSMVSAQDSFNIDDYIEFEGGEDLQDLDNFKQLPDEDENNSFGAEIDI